MSGMPSDSELDLFLDTAVAAAKEAGKLVLEEFYKTRDDIHLKGTVDLVTEVDVAVEKLIVSRISHKFPEHKFLAEEAAAKAGGYGLTDELTWSIDPIDGTTNFVHKYKESCVSIGLILNKEPIVGCVYNPILDELFKARKGGGAFLNDEPIYVSKADDLEHALICTNIGYGRSEDAINFMVQNLRHVIAAPSRGIRANGSAAISMCYAACGRVDAFYEWGIHPWDICAASVIVMEAGGFCASPKADTKEWKEGDLFDLVSRVVVSGNAKIVSSLVKVLDTAAPAYFNPVGQLETK